MGITQKEASEKVGVIRQTQMKAIKTGGISAEKSENGEWRVEPVELFRLWPPVKRVQQPLQSDLTASDTPALQAGNRLLREQPAELREERNAWREQAQRLALTDRRGMPRPGFLGALIRKGRPMKAYPVLAAFHARRAECIFDKLLLIVAHAIGNPSTVHLPVHDQIEPGYLQG